MTTSIIPGFHNLARPERLAKIVQACDLTPQQQAHLTAAVCNGALACRTTGGVNTMAEAIAPFTAKDGYKPLTKYRKTANGDLQGKIEIPMPVAIAAGATGADIDRVARGMVDAGTIREDAARALLPGT